MAHIHQKILVIQLRQLGDVLMTTPVVRELRRLFPLAEIHFLTEELGSQVLLSNQNINKVILCPKKPGITEISKLILSLYKEKYDLVVDCFSNPRSAFISWGTRAQKRIGFRFSGRKYAYTHLMDGAGLKEYSAQTKLRLIENLGANIKNSRIEFPIPNELKQFATDFFKPFAIQRKMVAFNVISRRSYKIWAPEQFIQVGDWLTKKGYFLFFVFGPGERELAQKVYDGLAEKQYALIDYKTRTIPEFRALLENCCLYFGNDGGIKHLAVCAGIPTFTVFQNVSWVNWTPPHSQKDFHISNCPENDLICSSCPHSNLCFPDLQAHTVIEKLDTFLSALNIES